MGYARSPFRHFESYIRIIVGLKEDDIQLISKQNYSSLLTYELHPGYYTAQDLQESVHLLGAHEGFLQIDYDDISMETKLVLTRFGGTFGTLRFDEKSIFNNLMVFKPFWGYKPTNAIHADSAGVYASEIIMNLRKTDEIHLSCDVIDGSVVNSIRQPILFNFAFGYTKRLKCIL